MANGPTIIGTVTDVEAADASGWQWVSVVAANGPTFRFYVPASAGMVEGEQATFPDAQPMFRCLTPEKVVPAPAPKPVPAAG
jgi:hypothetical protein